MKLGLLKERNDNRVALTPDGIPKVKALGLDIFIEKGAGEAAFFADEAYAAHAAVTTREEVISESDILLTINPLQDAELQKVRKGTTLVSEFAPFNDSGVAGKLRDLGLQGISMDMIPRTTLAQSMDVLSSMASIAGYRAVLEAALYLPRFFPMMITAAGSIRPARVLVLGAGVAGLQAIATARRLGAVVEAFDTRKATKEEVESLGAKFVEVAGAREDAGAGGYAVEQTQEFLQRQRAEVQARAAKADVIIATAQVRGRKAPLLVSSETIGQMRPGSVIVDLASSTGGNCELTKDNEVIRHQGVVIIGSSQLATRMPQDASHLYSNNLINLLKWIVKNGALNLDLNDEIVRGAFFTAEPVAQS